MHLTAETFQMAIQLQEDASIEHGNNITFCIISVFFCALQHILCMR